MKSHSDDVSEEKPRRDWRFWLIFTSIAMSLFISALELSAVSTALPVIVKDLGGSDFVWIGSAYALSATSFVPLSGGLAQVFGRRPVMLGSLLFFAVGSALCVAASSMNFLIAARTIQGVGGGGIASLTQIILSDLVPLQHGPLLLEQVQLLVDRLRSMDSGDGFSISIYRLRTPSGTFREKIGRMDWIGNLIVVAATTSCVIALTWSGIQFSWRSAHVLVPLLVGLIGLAAFLVYEAYFPKNPVRIEVPFVVMSTSTGLSGFVQTFIMPIALLALVYFMPVYFQACKGASPLASGVDTFGIAFSLAPAGIIGGISVAATKQYRPQLWFSWALAMAGCGLLSTLHADSARAHAIGFQIVVGIGLGVISSTTYFPVLAPLHVSSNAAALATFTFLRNFAQVWGVTIGGTILQNQLTARLPPAFASAFPQGTAIAYAVIPAISALDEPLKSEVRGAFAESLRVLWQVLIGVCGMGLVASLFMRHLPLHTSVDREWGMEERGKDRVQADSSTALARPVELNDRV
ncbi:MFS transporter superfamily protein [Pleurotus pulmonarius]